MAAAGRRCWGQPSSSKEIALLLISKFLYTNTLLNSRCSPALLRLQDVSLATHVIIPLDFCKTSRWMSATGPSCLRLNNNLSEKQKETEIDVDTVDGKKYPLPLFIKNISRTQCHISPRSG